MPTSELHYLSFHLKVFKMLGMWNDLTTPRHRALYQLFSYIVVAPSTFQLFSASAYVFVYLQHADVITVGFVCSLFGTVTKHYFIVKHHEAIKSLVLRLNHISPKQGSEEKLQRKYEDNGILLIKWFVFSGYLSCFTLWTISTIDSFYSVDKHVAFKAIYPFDDKKYYFIANTIQFFLCLTTPSVTLFTDGFLPILLMHVGLQLQFLTKSFKNMKVKIEGNRDWNEEEGQDVEVSDGYHRGAEVEGKIKGKGEDVKVDVEVHQEFNKLKLVWLNDEMNQSECHDEVILQPMKLEGQSRYHAGDMLNGRVPTNAKDYLVDCMKQHEAILSLIGDVQQVFSPIIFIQLFTNSVGICMIILKISTIYGNADGEIFGTLLYLMNALTQIWLFCYFGTKLMTQSEDVYTAAYDTPWYELSSAFRATLRLVMLRAQRPALLTGLNLYKLRNETFTDICSASLSYYTVLRQLQQERN